MPKSTDPVRSNSSSADSKDGRSLKKVTFF